MIYFFYGDDIEKRDEARDLIARLPAGEEGPFDSQLEMNDVSWDKEKFENLAKAESFTEKLAQRCGKHISYSHKMNLPQDQEQGRHPCLLCILPCQSPQV